MDASSTRVFGRALGALGRLQGELGAEERSWLAEIPLERALEAVDSIPAGTDFTDVTPELEALDAAVGLDGGVEWTRRYWNLVLLRLVARSFSIERGYRMPAAVHRQLLSELDRIVGQCESGSMPEDPLADGGFLENLGLARGTMIPFSMAVCELPMWIPEWVPASFPRLDGRPWMFLHLSGLRGDELSDDEAYVAGAQMGIEFFRLNPNYAGCYGVGWLADPTLGEVSPHLAVLTKWLTELGATVSSLGRTDEDSIDQATSSSRTRRRLYEEGRWTPTDQFLYWPAERLLAWADATGL